MLFLDLLLGRKDIRDPRSTGQILTAVALVGTGLAAFFVVRTPDLPGVMFGGMLALDPFARFFKLLFLIVAAFALVFAAMSEEIPRARLGQYIILLLTVTFGMCLLAGSRNLLMAYLSLELVSIPSYVLAGFRRGDRRTSEAALKYVIYGGIASGLSLYGFSLLYGLTGSLDFRELITGLTNLAYSPQSKLVLIVAIMMSLSGFAYKVSATPFHMWCPDVYEGAPTPFTAFLSVGPKAAGFAVLIRFVQTALGGTLEPVIPWPQLIGLVAAATMTIGNLTALVQRNVKRLLAFSSIAHAGYLLMGVSAGTDAATRAVELYFVFYLLMNMGAFLAVQAVRARTGSEDIDGYRALGSRSPLLALILAVFLFSLAGVPPLAGFIGKFYLFASLLETGTMFFYGLAFVGVLNSVVSLFYYARVVKAMYLKNPRGKAMPVPLGPGYSVLLLILAVPTLVLGVYWQPLINILSTAAGMAH
ncbi:MAG: NADH-quinone oxidoreductase subunit N [Deltaproteobacteria bacterium]|nr:NADH-quinone oxidoreductase subunit N [Deltaproteobacteria bacterium]